MIKGLYTGTMGMLACMTETEVIANNLANSSTTGFKRDVAIFKSYPGMDIRRINDNYVVTPMTKADLRPPVGSMGTGVEVNEIPPIFEQGAIRETFRKLDFAIMGDGLFTIQTKDGEKYTRNGSFSVNRDGYLTDYENNPVLGEKGPIYLGQKDFTVNEKGEIFTLEKKDGEPESFRKIDAFSVVDFEQKRALNKVGNNLFEESEWSGRKNIAKEYTLNQGFLEMSNVNVITEMVTLIEAQRSYEFNQRVVTSHDQVLDRAVNDLGRIA